MYIGFFVKCVVFVPLKKTSTFKFDIFVYDFSL
jgi:hypothetical protein